MEFTGYIVLISLGLASFDGDPTNVRWFMAIGIPLSPQWDGREMYRYRQGTGQNRLVQRPHM